MALTTAQQVRLRIQDLPAWFETVRAGDGTAATFDIPFRNLTTASAYVAPGGTAWSATGATIEASGVVSLSGIISANTAWKARGVHSVFSDDEISHFTAVGGSVAGAALEAVHVLMFDGLKRAVWATPDGSEYDDTAALTQLKALYDTLKDEIAESQAGDGGFSSWAIGQGDSW